MDRNEPKSGESAGRPRIALFTHDTYGLGHVRRSSHIVRAVLERVPEAAVLFITGSPALGALAGLPANADYLRIPTIVKSGSSRNRPSHLPIGRRAVSSLRKRLIRSALDSFRPDLFMVDNFPLGSGKELLPALERLRELSIPAVLGLRDILDRPEVVRATWSKHGVYDVLERYYDRILVYGSPEILDVGEAYALPSDLRSRVRYCGYVVPRDLATRQAADLQTTLGLEGPIVLCTVGGGGDGFPLLSCLVQAIRRLPDLSAVAITGPLMGSGDRERIRELAAGQRRIVVCDSVADLPSMLAAADLVVSMGGYNTIAELLALKRRAVVVPRNWRYGEFDAGVRAGEEAEQPMRAAALQRLGLIDVVSPEELTPESLATAIANALRRPDSDQPPTLPVNGAERAAEQVLSVIEERAGHVEA